MTFSNQFVSAPDSQHYRPWIGIPILIARSSLLFIRTVAAKPNILTAFTHGIVLLLYWVVTLSLCTCEALSNPGIWFLLCWTAVSCVELFLSGSVGRALWRHLTGGNTRKSRQFLLTIFVLLFLLLPSLLAKQSLLTSRRVFQLALIVQAGVHFAFSFLLVIVQDIHSSYDASYPNYLEPRS